MSLCALPLSCPIWRRMASRRDDRRATRLAHAQDLYRQKQYALALQCFNKLEAEYVDVPLLLLDGRAATYAKLQKPVMALRDGERMIRIFRTDAKGYLRTGQILVSMNKLDKAWSIYQSGLRHVPADSDDGRLLRTVANRLAIKMAPERACDPLLLLPIEIVQSIFEYLDFKDIVYLLRVCKGWQRVLTTSPLLWRRMEYSMRKKTVSAASLRRYLWYAKGQPTHLTVATPLPFTLFAPNTFQWCKSLTFLELRIQMDPEEALLQFIERSPLTTLVCGKDIAFPSLALWRILQGCATLRRLEIEHVARKRPLQTVRTKDEVTAHVHSLPQLEVLVLRSPASSARSYLSDVELHLVTWVPLQTRLQKLILHGITGQSNGFGGDLTILDLSELPLKEFRMTDCYSLPIHLPASLTKCCFELNTGSPIVAPHGFPLLEDLQLFAPLGHQPVLSMVIRRCQPGTLRRLSFEYPTAQIGAELLSFLEQGYLDGLCALHMDQSEMDDTLFTALAARCSQLVELQIPNNRFVTGVGIRALLEKPGARLEKLDIVGCERISRDAIDMALQRGVRVHYGHEAQKGRRLRYGA